MRVPITPADAKKSYFCPFALPEKVYCLGDACMSWEEDDDGLTDHGDCSLPSHRREIANATGPLFRVETCKAGVEHG